MASAISIQVGGPGSGSALPMPSLNGIWSAPVLGVDESTANVGSRMAVFAIGGKSSVGEPQTIELNEDRASGLERVA